MDELYYIYHYCNGVSDSFVLLSFQCGDREFTGCLKFKRIVDVTFPVLKNLISLQEFLHLENDDPPLFFKWNWNLSRSKRVPP